MVSAGQLQKITLCEDQQVAWRQWGRGAPLVMLHGWSMSSAVFHEVAPVLGQNFKVLCPDFPGHGESDSIDDMSLRGFGSLISKWFQLLGLDSAVLLGWSLGGQVALQMVLDKVVPLNQLLLVSTTAKFCQSEDWPHALTETQLKALARNLNRSFEKTLRDFFNLQFFDETLPKERYREILKIADRSTKLSTAMNAVKGLQILRDSDLRKQLAQIDLPTQVLHGQIDQIIPAAAGQFLADSIPGATFEIISAVGHAPFISQPETCCAHWLEYLQKN